MTFRLFGLSLASINTIFFFFIIRVYFKIIYKIMKETNKKTLEEIIRVDHAGERGAIKDL